MRVVIQRVREASVRVDGQIVGEISRGLLVLLGVRSGDSDDSARWLAEKCIQLRIFPDDEGKMNRSLQDIAGSLLVVSQFTLYGDCQKGRRPSFIAAARGPEAEALYTRFVEQCRMLGIPTATGVFGADMQVQLTNDGPVTLVIDHPASDP